MKVEATACEHLVSGDDEKQWFAVSLTISSRLSASGLMDEIDKALHAQKLCGCFSDLSYVMTVDPVGA